MDLDEPFRASLVQMLRDDAHEVQAFAVPADVPPLEDLDHVALVIADYLLPGEHGIAFADRFHRAHPHSPILLVSTYRTGVTEAQVAARDFIHVLDKPVDYDLLHEQIHRLVR